MLPFSWKWQISSSSPHYKIVAMEPKIEKHCSEYLKYILLLKKHSCRWPGFKSTGSLKLWTASSNLQCTALKCKSLEMYICTAHFTSMYGHPECMRCTWYSCNGCVQGCNAARCTSFLEWQCPYCSKTLQAASVPSCMFACFSWCVCTETRDSLQGQGTMCYWVTCTCFRFMKLHLMSESSALLHLHPQTPHSPH